MPDQKPNEDIAGDEPSLGELGRALFGEDSGPAQSPGRFWQPPAPEALQKLLPQYEILSMLGHGGMGAVYLASQPALDRLVAIKILSNDLHAADAGFSERFKNEARALAKLSHPGIIAVHDFGQTDSGLHYIVMEYVEGTDVQKMIAANRRLHTEHAMAIAAHVCDALHYAHERGIIHRDIKPANIMVGYDGAVKVTDFGLAKISLGDDSIGITHSGATLGTPHYIAPESLILGAQADRRVDIYATGVMLYHMLTGKLPQGLFELPSIQVPGLDPRFDAIIARAMREDRDLRYPTAADMRAGLDSILTQPIPQTGPGATLPGEARPQRPGDHSYHPPQPPVITQTEKKRSALAWLTSAVLALAGLAAWLYLERAASAPGRTLDAQTARTAVLQPASAAKEPAFINSLGMKFVPVPGARVLFSIYETRYQDYAAYAAGNPGINEEWKNQSYGSFTVTERAEEHPVTHVNWEEAVSFCEWLTRKERETGILTAQGKYRLPTDAEWSHAVGIGEWEESTLLPRQKSMRLEDVYPWGGSFPPGPDDGNYADRSAQPYGTRGDDPANYLDYDDGYPLTAPVGSFKPNGFGLYDMGGNVMEWCQDWYDAGQQDRVRRGGSLRNCVSIYTLSSNRSWQSPFQRANYAGFRVVLELPAE